MEISIFIHRQAKSMCDMSEPRPIFKIFNADVVVYCLTRIFSVLLAVDGCKVFQNLLSNVFLAPT